MAVGFTAALTLDIALDILEAVMVARLEERSVEISGTPQVAVNGKVKG